MTLHKPATLLPENLPKALTLRPNLIRPYTQATIPLFDWMGWRARINALYPSAKASTGTQNGIALHKPTAMAQNNLYVVVGRVGGRFVRLAVKQILLIWL